MCQIFQIAERGLAISRLIFCDYKGYTETSKAFFNIFSRTWDIWKDVKHLVSWVCKNHDFYIFPNISSFKKDIKKHEHGFLILSMCLMRIKYWSN